ncbi:bsl0879 [Bradyrhizobium diazoefficiens USDA 110]|uniref:Bsl0879 protein n=1 Tax=Bradyrhizobium diazoefficiens (strain JCM 10833 / BCRC 13528 / IAM 13628 / NBRC 14792 / USDA 110) TaxID=224911 RepID=Q89W14_BRADU|nr:hypothetical protein AAV28_01245 [Bradyrhizobium diazoefficiens USDA 110]QBP19825.1 hypothetical protein Bdiaspc4_04225 [Bradyrhizobium diazoefficiens]BAC46144.1 bsl0879 [Bradyrhizobium diazoefficiens USDA 110]
MDDSITFAIGDIHGCSGKLQSLLTQCDTVRCGRNARFILLGDYVDRGSESQDVLDLLMRQAASLPVSAAPFQPVAR